MSGKIKVIFIYEKGDAKDVEVIEICDAITPHGLEVLARGKGAIGCYTASTTVVDLKQKL